jgi:hypothetical protein
MLYAIFPITHCILRIRRAKAKGIKANATEEVGLSLRNKSCTKDTAGTGI